MFYTYITEFCFFIYFCSLICLLIYFLACFLCLCCVCVYVYVYNRNWLGRLCQDFTIAFEDHSSQSQKKKEKDKGKDKDKEEYVRNGTYASRSQTAQNGTYMILIPLLFLSKVLPSIICSLIFILKSLFFLFLYFKINFSFIY